MSCSMSWSELETHVLYKKRTLNPMLSPGDLTTSTGICLPTTWRRCLLGYLVLWRPWAFCTCPFVHFFSVPHTLMNLFLLLVWVKARLTTDEMLRGILSKLESDLEYDQHNSTMSPGGLDFVNRNLGINLLTALPLGIFDSLVALSALYVCACLSFLFPFPIPMLWWIVSLSLYEWKLDWQQTESPPGDSSL